MTRPETVPVRPGEALPLDALRAALRGRVAGEVDALEVEQFPGGFSNLTYLLRLGVGPEAPEYVLRRAPLGPVAPGAHNMAREAKLLSRLHVAFPAAPRPELLVEDPAVLGAPFYLMERRRGVVVRDRLTPEYAALPDAPGRLGNALMDTLADLHRIDLDAAGLRDLGRPDGFNARQVSGWSGRWRRARGLLGDRDDLPAELPDEAVIAWLTSHTPPESAHALVHNDYKLDNLMLDPADPGCVVALLDWEMTTLGDPLVDLGLTLTYWTLPTLPGGQPNRVGAVAPGFPGRDTLVARYQAQSARHVTSTLGWYEVLGHFKLAAIVLQIYARYRAGQTADPRFAPLGAQAAWLIARAHGLTAST